jgi:hypothetical protein
VSLREVEDLGLKYEVVALSDELAVHPVSVVFDANRISVAGRAFLTFLPRPRS